MEKDKYYLLKLIILAISFIVNFVFAQNLQSLNPDEQQEILQAITQKLSTVENLKADFRQIRHMEILMEPLVSQGICYFEKPDKLRWELTKPYQSILIYNDNNIAKFDIRDNKLEKLNLGTKELMREILKQIISWMQGDFAKADDIYDLKIFRDDKYKLVLTPKSEDLVKSIRSIEMIFNANLQSISSVQINESDKNYIKIEFINTINNIEINEQIFDINEPLIVKNSNY